jgi:hypothetical protein
LENKEYIPNALIRPSVDVVKALQQLENIYTATGLSILSRRGIVAELLRLSQHVNFPIVPCHDNMRHFFFSHYFILRVFHSVKLINQSLKDGRQSGKKKQSV